MSKELMKLGAAVLVMSAVVGCGGAAVEGESEDGLSASRKSYVAARRDQRRCPAPTCGGYWLRDVNRKGNAETYVGSFDFSAAVFDDATVDAIVGAPAEELILHGRLGAADERTKVRPFVVSSAWRGMPGQTVAAGDALYVVESQNIQCFAAPCLNQKATRLNSGAVVPFSSYDLGGASVSYLDQQWLKSRVMQHGAVVSAKIVDGVRMAAGADKVLAASQVFIKLPDAIGPCPAAPTKKCAEGEVNVYERDENRCLRAVSCVKPGYCAQVQPSCEAGYSLVQWREGANACNAAACDPSFVVPPQAE